MRGVQVALRGFDTKADVAAKPLAGRALDCCRHGKITSRFRLGQLRYEQGVTEGRRTSHRTRPGRELHGNETLNIWLETYKISRTFRKRDIVELELL
jgi:hypothetical protein